MSEAKEITRRDVATMEWWTVREVADRLRVSEDVVLREIDDKNLRAKKVGGRWRIHYTAIEEYEGPAVVRSTPRRGKLLEGVPDVLGVYGGRNR